MNANKVTIKPVYARPSISFNVVLWAAMKRILNFVLPNGVGHIPG